MEEHSNSGWTDNSGYKNLELYPSGNYKSFIPMVDTLWLLQNIEVKLLADHPVRFYDSGTMKSCTLADNFKLMAYGVPVIIKGGTPIEFHESEQLRKCTLAKPKSGLFSFKKEWDYQGKAFKEGDTLEFSSSGDII